MKAIIGTEEVFNEHGDIIKIIYHYEDGTTREKKVFILASQVAERDTVPKK